jgi:hypothetical protein
MNGNDFMSWVLRSPFHGMLSGGMLLITVTGCKTGRKYTTPVSYYREGDYLWVITTRSRTWWKNLRGGADISILLRRRPISTFADTECDEQAVAVRLADYLHHIPQAANSLGVRVENGQVNVEDAARVAKDRLFVKIGPLAK